MASWKNHESNVFGAGARSWRTGPHHNDSSNRDSTTTRLSRLHVISSHTRPAIHRNFYCSAFSAYIAIYLLFIPPVCMYTACCTSHISACHMGHLLGRNAFHALLGFDSRLRSIKKMQNAIKTLAWSRVALLFLGGLEWGLGSGDMISTSLWGRVM